MAMPQCDTPPCCFIPWTSLDPFKQKAAVKEMKSFLTIKPENSFDVLCLWEKSKYCASIWVW